MQCILGYISTTKQQFKGTALTVALLLGSQAHLPAEGKAGAYVADGSECRRSG